MRNDPLEEMDALYLLLAGELTAFERDFLKSVRRETEWSEKQRSCYERIKNKYLRTAPDGTNDRRKDTPAA